MKNNKLSGLIIGGVLGFVFIITCTSPVESNTSETSATSSNLKNLNLVSLSDITSSVDSNATTSKPSTVGSDTKMDKVRLIYATNTAKTTYSDSYEAAYPYLYNSVKNTRSLGTETSSRGDGKVILRELLCVGDN